jgi:hypothetical protein
MTEIRFFNSNSPTDAGFMLDVEEVARRFWASPEADQWLAGPSGRLERLALSWVADNVGQWDRVPEDWPPIFDAIHAAMPRVGL